MTTASANELPEPSVLVVDDVPENLRYLMQTLSAEGYKVRPAKSGRLALEAARLHPPDLVLLDINMPDMDGYEVCTALKTETALEEIPIIFISALDQTFDKVKAFAAGGVDYITKPFEEQEVVARVRAHVDLHRLQRERQRMVEELQMALEEVKTLRGYIPICANCKKIRDDDGYWQRVEIYMSQRTRAEFTHGICPDCVKELYPELREG